MTVTETEWAAFLALIRANPTIGNKAAFAAANVHLTRDQISSLLAEPDRRDEYNEARGRSQERIRAAIAQRAIDGIEEPIVSVKGEIVGYKRIYSDRLLALMAKAHLPEYRETKHLEITGGEGGPVQVQQGVSLSAVLGVLIAAGATTPDRDGAGTPQPALPAPSPVLPEPS